MNIDNPAHGYLRDARRMLDAIGAHAVGTAEHFAACDAVMAAGAQLEKVKP